MKLNKKIATAKKILNKKDFSKEEMEFFENLFEEFRSIKRSIKEQSRKVTMGEMVDAIAHQWKQPLSIISLYNQMLLHDYSYGDVDEKYINNFSNKVELQINHLLNTLDEFREFLRPNRTKEFFSVKESVSGALHILQDVIKGNQISITLEKNFDFMIYGVQNDFKHIIINLINNSKDAFIENSIKDRKIDIGISQKYGLFSLIVKDNGGGIPVEIIDKIFEENLTTKENGTGVGLYMTKQIVKDFGGKISVENVDCGAMFTISIHEGIL
jgi:signal transduction histidine kinase